MATGDWNSTDDTWNSIDITWNEAFSYNFSVKKPEVIIIKGQQPQLTTSE